MTKTTKNTNETASWRKVSKDKYIIAGIITFLIFALGLALGLVLEDQRYNIIDEINQEQDVKYLSLQLQFLYLNAFSNQDNCPAVATTLNEAVKDLSDSLSEVVSFEEEKEITATQKTNIMRRYILDNLRYWLLAQESQQKCELDIVPILYFYSTDCPSCPNQGTILTFFKKQFGEQVLVFPINLDLREEEPMVEVVMNQFDITKQPSLIINGEKYEGVVGKEQMHEIICNSLEDSNQCDQEVSVS